MLAIEGANLTDADTQIERFGHEIRAAYDEDYKRATWGRRPEDVAEIAGFMGDMTGRR